jgi:hypothetical protein
VVLAHWWLYADGRLDHLAQPYIGALTAGQAADLRARLEAAVPRAAAEVVARIQAEQEAREAKDRESAKALAEMFARAFAPRPG